MARVKRYLDSRASDSHERWLVSYADFITLLFAFFVVMYAISSVNEGRYRVLGVAIGSAFRVPQPAQAVSGTIALVPGTGAAAWRRRERRIEGARAAIEAALRPLVEGGEAQLHASGRGLVIDIGAGALFPPGEAQLAPGARAPLAAAAQVLRGLTAPVEVEGHTDNVAISTPRFPSNWELSAARASRVARFLAEQGVAPARLAALGYAEYRPVADNDTEAGRARNRRVSIVVVDPEPGAPESATPRPAAPMEFKVQPPR